MTNEYRPHDIDLNSITLMNYQGNVIDLRNLCLEFNVYEDLYDVGMKCDVILSDALGLIERVPIVGDETLIVSFKTPTFDITRSYVFSVYSVQDRIKQNDRAQTYVIHGVSQEILNDLRRRVNKSYNQRIHQTVENIYSQKLRPKETEFNAVSSRTRNVESEPTKDVQSFIAPENTSPLEFIRFLQKHAQSEQTRASDYMFWQNIEGWHFRTMNSLLDNEVTDDFYFTQPDQEPESDNQNLANEGPDEPIRKYQKIAFVNYDTQFNIFNMYEDGLFYNRTEVFDPLRKKSEEKNWNYDKDFDKIHHLSDKKVYTEDSPHANIEENFVSYLMVGEIGEDYKNLPYIQNARGSDIRVSNPYNLHKFHRFMTASMAQMNNIMIDIGIPGNSDIKTGDLIRVYLQQESSEQEYIDKNNLLLGQKNPIFLVSAVRHTFNREANQYTTILQCIRDTWGIRPREFDAER